MRMHVKQHSIAEQIVELDLDLHEWTVRVSKLIPAVYPHDAALSVELQRIISDLSTIDLACIGTDDPTAPPPDASARDILRYQFRRWPEKYAEFSRVIARADQLLGRRRMLAIINP